MPSPVPTSCSRKSLYGWITLLPSAAGTIIAPPLIDVLAGAVIIEPTWHVAHPMRLNTCSPAVTVAVIAPRGGTMVARMKFANALTSSPSSSGSGFVSYGATSRPLAVFSSGSSGLVTPISFR